jgi:hypothetical protein
VLSSSAPGGVATISPMPKTTAYDILLEISNKVPPKDKITLDIEQLNIDDQKVDIQGTTKTSDGIDLLVAELKKVECFTDVQRGPTDTNQDGTKTFRLTILTACM